MNGSRRLEIGDRFINNGNGKEYTVIDINSPDTLLSYATGNGNSYLIAWQLHPSGYNRFEWNQGHYFNEDLQGAKDAMIKRAYDRHRRNEYNNER